MSQVNFNLFSRLGRLSVPPKRPNTLVFNDYTQHCLDEIVATPIYKADELLVSHVLLQRISEDAVLSCLNYHNGRQNSSGSSPDSNYSFKTRLQAAERTLSPELLTYRKLLLLVSQSG